MISKENFTLFTDYFTDYRDEFRLKSKEEIISFIMEEEKQKAIGNEDITLRDLEEKEVYLEDSFDVLFLHFVR